MCDSICRRVTSAIQLINKFSLAPGSSELLLFVYGVYFLCNTLCNTISEADTELDFFALNMGECTVWLDIIAIDFLNIYITVF